jgi:hypothetical protein
VLRPTPGSIHRSLWRTLALLGKVLSKNGHTSPTRPGYLRSRPPLCQRTKGMQCIFYSRGHEYLETPEPRSPALSKATAPTVSCLSRKPTGSSPNDASVSEFRVSSRVRHLCHSSFAAGETKLEGSTSSSSRWAANECAPSHTSVLAHGCNHPTR